MRIIVCIKQVPDTAEVRINPETNTLIREGVQNIINPFDLHAIEAGLEIREKVGGKVTVLTMGPPQAEDALKEAISMGADEAVLLTDKAFAGSDTLATSYTLARAIERIGADIVFCGKQAIDGDTAQVGPEIAEFLGIPHITCVRKIEEVNPVRKIGREFSNGVKDGFIRVQRLMDDGYDVVESSLPILLTVVKELNVPRLPSLRGKIAAKKALIKRMGPADIGAHEEELGLKGSPTQVKNIFAPEARSGRMMLKGTTKEQVNALIEELRRIKCL